MTARDRDLVFTWIAALIAAAIAVNILAMVKARAEPGNQHDIVATMSVRGQDAMARGGVIGSRPAGCPRAWCGCWLARELGFTGSKARMLWLARNWARMFPRAAMAPGNVAVFARGRGGHVGKIVAVHGNGRITLKSGNDGGAVRVRARSTRGLIAVVNPRVQMAGAQ